MPFGFDWDSIDNEYQYMAVDADGETYAYVDKPSFEFGAYTPLPSSGFWYLGRVSPEDFAVSLVKRPSTKEDFIVNTENKGKGHKHAALMLEYAQDATSHEKPWELWEYRYRSTEGWTTLSDHPTWAAYVEYRRIPRTVTITIPEDVARDFMRLILVSDAGKAVSSAIEDALNNR